MNKISILSDVINAIQHYSWEDWLFLPKDGKWSIESECAVLNLDDIEEAEIPKLAIDNNLKPILNVADIQDIVSNYKDSHQNCTANDLFKAIMFYFENDSFIE